MNSKPTMLAALALSGALALSACGSSSSGGGSTGSAGGSTGSSSSSSSPATSSSSSSSSSTSSSSSAGGKVDSTELGQKIASAVKARNTAHFTLSSLGVKGSGQVDIAKHAALVTLGVAGRKITSLQVGKVYYVRGILPGGKYVKIDPNGTSALDKALSSISGSSSSADPSTTGKLLSAGKVTDAGNVAGGEKYHIVIPLSAYSQVLKTKASTLATIKGPVTLDLVVSSDNLPIRATSALHVGNRIVTTLITYSQWGSKVSITAPPASQIGKAPTT